MSFWTEPSLEPKRNFRFKLTDGGAGEWWYAKTVDKPSFDISSSDYQLINHKFKYPGIATWKPITITIADIGKRVYAFRNELNSMGYAYPDASVPHKGLEKLMEAKDGAANITNMIIEHIEASGTPQETWRLYGAFFTSISFSQLDYSSDDISVITIEVAYDYAKVT